MQSNQFQARPIAILLAASALAQPFPAAAQTELKLGVEGLGEIDASTPFDTQTLRTIERSIDWRPIRRTTESGYQEVIIGTRRGRKLVTLISDGRGRIAAIEIHNSQISNWLGPRVGEAHRPLQQNLQLGSCRAGQETHSGSVICTAAETDRITYVFSGRWNGPDGRMPPDNALDGWTISHIIWKPERFAQIGRPLSSRPIITPSFDCTQARGSIEQLICDDPELAELDNRMSTLYARKYDAAGLVEKLSLRAHQIGWVRGRNDCWKSVDRRECVAGTYRDRINELQDDPDATNLAGTSWKAARIAGDRIPESIDINLKFDTDGRLNGSSGCNRYFASYMLEGRQLRVSQVGGTRRMCPELEMLAETRFLDALGKTEGWGMRNGELILFGTGAELTFIRQ
ncbi:DUF1131 family protein [Erythrobacter sp. THAF29]|uniref:DUF1131 family protein n=1 Tax=Erythrobacter sp. THAF29 TaxID=2587851 RepID=UPI00126969DB|nr:DUF1131 family protein [Erythrobacter sp. THAF29]QFT78520.1 RpoE-regulated lipoprotein [Erythrobacter sp. THAF29]